MKNATKLLQISGLTKLEKLELEELISADEIRFEEHLISEGKYGELGTTVALVVVSVAAINAIALWLVKNRRGESMLLTVKDKNGITEKEFTLKIESYSSETPQNEIIQEIGKNLNLDMKSLLRFGQNEEE